MLCCAKLEWCLTLCDPMDCSLPGSSVYGDSPGQNTGVGCHALLQGIFPTQQSNPGLPHCRWILYRLSHQGSPSSLPAKNNLSHYHASDTGRLVWRHTPVRVSTWDTELCRGTGARHTVTCSRWGRRHVHHRHTARHAQMYRAVCWGLWGDCHVI